MITLMNYFCMMDKHGRKKTGSLITNFVSSALNIYLFRKRDSHIR